MESGIRKEVDFADVPVEIGMRETLFFGIMGLHTGNPELFYQTGYETILLKRDRHFAMETLISSLFLFDQDAVVFSTGAESDRMVELLNQYDVNHQAFLENSDGIFDLVELEKILSNNRKITSILLTLGEIQAIDNDLLYRLSLVASHYKVNVAVNCVHEILPLHELQTAGVSFMIGRVEESDAESMVIAKRSKLVGTEGNSRTRRFDLHNYWQLSMKNRKPELKPMSC